MPGQPERTPEQQLLAAQMRAESLLEQIQHWLDAIAKFRDLRKAPRRRFTQTGCGRNGGDHTWHVRIVPRPPRPTTHLACVSPRTAIPARVLMNGVILPLRGAGHNVAAPFMDRCGCITFNVTPGQRADA